ncbi:MAG: hypothetical protein MJ245_04735 [Clostridia bacterium]|nr:hypothetical protein [Clostridia bacterium]
MIINGKNFTLSHVSKGLIKINDEVMDYEGYLNFIKPIAHETTAELAEAVRTLNDKVMKCDPKDKPRYEAERKSILKGYYENQDNLYKFRSIAETMLLSTI